MKNTIERISSIKSQGLADLFKMGADFHALSPEDLREELEHLLSIPFGSALNQLPGYLAEPLREDLRSLGVSATNERSAIACLDQLFRLAKPPLPMLRFAKDLGKAILGSRNCCWPREVGEAIYYGSYAAAQLCSNEPIGKLNPVELQRGFDRLGRHPWMPENLRALFERGTVQITSRAG